MTNILKQIPCIFFGLLFLAIGLFHFYAYEFMAIFVPLPKGAKIFVLLVASLISISAIGIIVNKYLRSALIMIASIFSITGFMVLTPTVYKSSDELIKSVQEPNLVILFIAILTLFYIAIAKPKN